MRESNVLRRNARAIEMEIQRRTCRIE